MTLPDDLKNSLELIFEKVPRGILAKASIELTNRYRNPDRDTDPFFMTSDTHRMAYLAVRFPATFAVVHRVLSECQQRMPDFAPVNVCDIGAGPGTATWAAIDVFPGIKEVSLYERDSQLVELGKNLMKNALIPVLKNAQWQPKDLILDPTIAKHDLVILSYVVGELPFNAMSKLIDNAWESTSQIIAVIEPGTPHGFERIRMIRDQLLQKNAFLVAPCPHHNACPMEKGDWCHFAQRVERSSIHMDVKGVSMGYEDEKFSYIIASKSPVKLPEARILRHPQHHSGHIDLVLCAQSGLEKKIISKKHGALYKQTRKLEWGDPWPPSLE